MITVIRDHVAGGRTGGHFPDPYAAILALARELTPEQLGRLRLDDLHRVQMELAGVRVIQPKSPVAESESDP